MPFDDARDSGGTHFDEQACFLYLEGRLDAARAASLAVHAAACQRCHARLHALEREARLVGAAMLEAVEPLPTRLAMWPERLSASDAQRAAGAPAFGSSATDGWAWLLSCGLAAVTLYSVWTTVIGPWLDQLDQSGFQGSSLLASVLFSDTLWNGWNALLDALQYAALAAVGIGGLLLLRQHWRQRARPRRRGWAVIGGVLAVIGVTLAMPNSAGAAEVRRGQTITVPVGETIHNDLIAFGNTVLVDGTVDGDAILFGQHITVDGHVTGDVIAFGQHITVDGPVDGSVRTFADTISLGSPIARNVTAFAAHLELDPRSTVGGGMIGFTGNAIVDGKVTRDLLFFSGDTTLDGTVGGDILLHGGPLFVGPTSQIGGRLHVIGDRQPEIASGAKLGQPVQFDFRAPQPRYRTGGWFVRQVLGFGAAVLCGLLLMKLFPGLFAAARLASRHVGLSMSVGALLLLAGFMLGIFSILLIVAGSTVGIATMTLYAPLLYGSQVFVGQWIGEKLSKSAPEAPPNLGYLALGLLILRVLGAIPVLGFFVWTVVLAWGAGAGSIALWKCTRAPNPTLAAPAAA